MNLDLINLIKLQQLDQRIQELKKVEQEGPLKLEAVEAELEAAEQKVEESLAGEQEMIKRRRDLETEIEDYDRKIIENQSRQLLVKTNEEYRAILKENDFLRKANSTREDEVLELMEAVETLSRENKELTVWLEDQKKALAQKEKDIRKWIAASAKELGSMDVQRAGILRDIPDNFIALYERVYERHKGKAVVSIIDGVCQECHMKIPPQKFNELQRNDKLMSCPNCARIMFWGDHDDYAHII